MRSAVASESHLTTTHTHTRTHARTHAHTHARTHARTRAHTHTHTCRRRRALVFNQSSALQEKVHSMSRQHAKTQTPQGTQGKLQQKRLNEKYATIKSPDLLPGHLPVVPNLLRPCAQAHACSRPCTSTFSQPYTHTCSGCPTASTTSQCSHGPRAPHPSPPISSLRG